MRYYKGRRESAIKNIFFCFGFGAGVAGTAGLARNSVLFWGEVALVAFVATVSAIVWWVSVLEQRKDRSQGKEGR